MKRRYIALAFLAVVAVSLVAGWLRGDVVGFRFWSWHQKLTVSVETPRGIVTASAVTAASWDMPPRWFKIGDSGGWHGAGSLEGEAVILEVAPKRYLFVLLRWYSADLAVQLFADPPLKSGHPDEYKRVLDQLTEGGAQSREVTPKQYPLLVAFGDVRDPASVRRVDPADLAATFGPGYRLNSITMTITDEPMTEGKVEGVLGWLNHLDDYRTDRSNPFTNTLSEDIGYLRRK